MNSSADLVEQFCWELRLAFQDLAATADLELRELGISAGDRAILELLAREPEPVSISDLARRVGVSRQHIQQAIARLPNPGWIEQAHVTGDRRLVLVSLSRSGRTLWDRRRKRDIAFFNWLAPRIEASALRTALAVLENMRKDLHSRRGATAGRRYA